MAYQHNGYFNPARHFGRRERLNHIGIPRMTNPKIVTTGTAIDSGVGEAAIVSGGETIILTLHDGEWTTSGTAFNATRQGIIDGRDSQQSEAAGWNVEVRDKEVVTAVARTDADTVTITLTASGSYSITADETVDITIPAAAIAHARGIQVTSLPDVVVTAA
jgi:hypothetical protein